MGDKILVVGATGLVGTEVVRELLERGQRVKAASRKGTAVPGAETAVFELGRPETFESALTDVDRVFLLAPSESLAQANELIPPFLRALEAAGVRRLVCMTGMGSYRPEAPMKPIEVALEESGIDCTLLRPNWFNQNFAPGYYLEGIKSTGKLFLPMADAKVSFVDTRDIGAVAAAALAEDGHRGEAYTLTGPEALDHAEACSLLSRAAGRDIAYVPISDDDMRKALVEEGLPDESVEYLITFYRVTRDGVYARVSDDIETVLGRAPIAFATYAEDYAEFLK